MDVEARNSGGAEHRHVATVVFESQAQVEAGRAQLPHGGLLEIAGELVVAPGAHDQQIPADRIPAEPCLGEVVDAVRSRREEDDLQLLIEQVEERAYFFDDGVFAARVEEGAPVLARRFEVVLAARGVGEHAVDVDDDGLRWLQWTGAPGPVLGGVRHVAAYSSAGWLERYFDLMPSTTAGSASVVVSPSAWSSATSRNRRRMILPDRVFGSSSVKRIDCGRQIPPMSVATWLRNSSTSSSHGW